MTPKQKAEHIINECAFYTNSLYNARQCALIVANQMIEFFWKTHRNEPEFRYWKDVEFEIKMMGTTNNDL